MMKNLSLLLLLFFIVESDAQSIPNFWMNMYTTTSFYKTGSEHIESIAVHEKNWHASGGNKVTQFKYFFPKKNVVLIEMVKKRKEKSYTRLTFDDSNRLIKSENKYNVAVFGEQKEVHEYTYFNGNKTGEKHLDRNGKVLRYIKFRYNKKGHPTIMLILNANRQIIAKETASYKYDKDEYIYRTYDAEENLLLEQKKHCRFETGRIILNKFKDYETIYHPMFKIKKSYLSFEYKYDEYGNWIKRTVYFNNGKKKKKRAVVKRKIKYKE